MYFIFLLEDLLAERKWETSLCFKQTENLLKTTWTGVLMVIALGFISKDLVSFSFEVKFYITVREDTHKKRGFLVVVPLRFYPTYTNGLVVHAAFFLLFF